MPARETSVSGKRQLTSPKAEEAAEYIRLLRYSVSRPNSVSVITTRCLGWHERRVYRAPAVSLLKAIKVHPCEKTAHQNELLLLCESQEGVHQCWREQPTK